MAHFPEDLRTLIAATTAITSLTSTRIHYSHIPQPSAAPHVWFQVNADDEDLTLDGVGGMHEVSCDVECVGATPASAQDVADAVKTKLHGFKGAAGSSSIKGAWITDKSDDYEPFSISGDEGLSLVALNLRAFYTT